VIERALAPDPSLRYESASAMEAALSAVVELDGAIDPASARRTRLLGGTVVLMVVAGALWTFASLRPAQDSAGGGSPGAQAGTSPPGSRVYRYVGDADLAGPGAPSPDGRFVSRVLAGELALHEVSTGTRRTLTGKESGDRPGYVEGSRFSRDGSRVTYVRFIPQADENKPAIPEIRQIPSTGGRSRLLWRGSDDRWINFYHWAGDDDLILVGRWPESGPGELLVIATAGGQILASHALPSLSLTGASLSPDARFVAFEQPDPTTGYPDIHIWSIGTDTSRPLIRDTASDDSPVWTADGRYVLFMSNRSGDAGLWAQRVEDGAATGPPTRLDPNIGTGAPMGGLTQTGALFMRRNIGTRDVFSVEVDPYTLRLMAEPNRVTDQPRSATGTSAWSPDGTHLAFFRRDGERRSLVVRSMRDGREREFWRPGMGGTILPRWEPGGRSVLFKAVLDQKQGLHRLDLDTGTIATVLERRLNEYEPLPTPGMIVLSDRRTNEIVRVDLVTRREEVIHRLDRPWLLRDMGLSHRGDRLAFSSPSGGKFGTAIRILDLSAPTKTREVFRAPPGSFLAAYAWSLDDREVIVERDVNTDGTDDDKSHVWAIDVATGKARPLGLTVDRGMQQLQISPDGRYLSYDAGFPYQEVWVLENVAAALPK
jgi:Tol biopolymer transport system component